jgi:hypothetical protein
MIRSDPLESARSTQVSKESTGTADAGESELGLSVNEPEAETGGAPRGLPEVWAKRIDATIPIRVQNRIILFITYNIGIPLWGCLRRNKKSDPVLQKFYIKGFLKTDRVSDQGLKNPRMRAFQAYSTVPPSVQDRKGSNPPLRDQNGPFLLPIPGDHVSVKVVAILWYSLEGLKIAIDNSKALGIPKGPFKIVY